MDSRRIKILLVEDDISDQKLVKKSLAEGMMCNEIFTVESGEEALEYLSRSKEAIGENYRPHLILLDLNMPGMGGKEFLRRIKSDDELAAIPVVILTTSDSEQDITESYKLHAAGYIKKPVTPEDFRYVMRTLGKYWFITCKQT